MADDNAPAACAAATGGACPMAVLVARHDERIRTLYRLVDDEKAERERLEAENGTLRDRVERHGRQLARSSAFAAFVLGCGAIVGWLVSEWHAARAFLREILR